MYEAPATLELFILPGSMDLVAPAAATALEPQLEALQAWARQRGLGLAGSAMLGWDEWATRQLRQPIRPIFGLLHDPAYRVEYRPAQLVVELPLHVRSGLCNLAGIYDLVGEYRLEPLGAPLVPLVERRLVEHGTAAGYVPVTPRGTRSLYPASGWLSTKLGLHWAPPRLRQPLRQRDAWRQVGLLGLQASITLFIAALLGLMLPGIVLWLLGRLPAWAGLVQWLRPGVGSAGGALLLVGSGLLRQRLRAISQWNAFWSTLSSPQIKYFSEEVESVSVSYEL